MRGGLRLHLVIGVDFSTSNGPARLSHSLHHTSREGASYSFAVASTVSHLLAFFEGSTMEAWGLSASHAPVFELGGTQGEPEVASLAALLEGYRNARDNVEFGPKTLCAPLVQQAVAAAARVTQDRQTLTLCVMFVPRTPNDAAEVTGIAERSASAGNSIFFAMVGVGREPLQAIRGVPNACSLAACHGDPQRALLRQLFAGLPTQMEDHLKARSVVPAHYAKEPPKTFVEKTETSRLNFGVGPSLIVTPPSSTTTSSASTSASGVTMPPAPLSAGRQQQPSPPTSNPYSQLASTAPHTQSQVPPSHPYTQPATQLQQAQFSQQSHVAVPASPATGRFFGAAPVREVVSVTSMPAGVTSTTQQSYSTPTPASTSAFNDPRLTSGYTVQSSTTQTTYDPRLVANAPYYGVAAQGLPYGQQQPQQPPPYGYTQPYGQAVPYGQAQTYTQQPMHFGQAPQVIYTQQQQHQQQPVVYGQGGYIPAQGYGAPPLVGQYDPRLMQGQPPVSGAAVYDPRLMQGQPPPNTYRY